MKHKFVTLATLFTLTMALNAQENRLANFFSKGEFDGSFRLGYEYSSLDNTLSPGQNLSIRTRFGYKTAEYKTFRAYMQMQHLANLIEEHTSPNGGDTTRDPIADPDGMRVQQAWIETSLLPDTNIRGGRQEIIFDDARLIGNVGWRQFAQSFDGVLSTTKIDDLTINLAWIGNVNTIANTTLDLKNFGMINLRCTAIDAINASFFSYLLDAKTGNRDSITYGTRLTGLLGPLDYAATYALQEDFANSAGHNAYMANTYVGAKLGLFHLGLGYSELDGQDSNDSPFDTLFSTTHKFNGWADQFVATNGGGLAGGLEDAFADVSTKVADATIVLRYHQFRTAENAGGGTHSGDYGDETDLMFKRAFKLPDGNKLAVILQIARYNETNGVASNPTADEILTSLRATYTF